MPPLQFFRKYFGKPGKGSEFPLEDLRQDADAFNITIQLSASPSTTVSDAWAAAVQGGGYATRFKTFFNGRLGGSQGTASSTCMTYITATVSNPGVWVSRSTIIQWASIWGSKPVKSPTDIPAAQLQAFCGNWSNLLSNFAASG